jgi:hypothetical protein
MNYSISDLSALLTKYHSGDELNHEMGGACGVYGRQERCIEGSVGRSEGKAT